MLNDYKFVFVPGGDQPSNVLYIDRGDKKYLLCAKGYPEALEIIRKEIESDDIEIIMVNNEGFGAIDGSLTCRSVLIE